MQQGRQKDGAAKKTQTRRRKRNKSPEEPIEAYNSQIKLGILAAPCVLVGVSALIAALTGQDILGGGRMLHFGAALIGGLTAFTLLQMAFDRKPVLVIDEEGIRCRRPDVGLIPWPAVVGLGTSKATLLRRVLMIAVDETELSEQASRHMRRRVGLFSAFSPQIAKFEGQMRGWPSIHVPISYFSISPKDLEQQIAEKVHFYGK